MCIFGQPQTGLDWSLLPPLIHVPVMLVCEILCLSILCWGWNLWSPKYHSDGCENRGWPETDAGTQVSET